jgi:hypothetical protein
VHPARVLLLSALSELSRCWRTIFFFVGVLLGHPGSDREGGSSSWLFWGCVWVFHLLQCIFFWEWTREVGMESHFFMEAKALSFSMEKGKPELYLGGKEKRLLRGCLFGLTWLIVTVEEVLRFTVDEDFVKSTREASFVLTVWRGGSMDGCFLEVMALAEKAYFVIGRP